MADLVAQVNGIFVGKAEVENGQQCFDFEHSSDDRTGEKVIICCKLRGSFG